MVYVVQYPKPTNSGFTPDLSSAIQYGPIKYVFEQGTDCFRVPGPALRQALEVLGDFNPETDYMLWPNIGDPSAFVACMLALGKLRLSKVQMLHWNRARASDGARVKGQGYYTPVTFEL